MPVIMAQVNNRAVERRQDRIWARADKVAQDLAASNKEVAKKVSEVADTAASLATTTETKLDVIHALVNGNLTVSMNSQLVALRASRVALTTLADLQESSNKPAYRETRQQVEDVGKAVTILEREINDRLATERAANG